VCGVPVDLQTYLKVIFSVFYGEKVNHSISTMTETEKKQLLQLVHTIFKNDVGEQDFDFGCELILEYVSTTTSNTDSLDDEQQQLTGKKKNRHQKNHRTEETSRSEPIVTHIFDSEEFDSNRRKDLYTKELAKSK